MSTTIKKSSHLNDSEKAEVKQLFNRLDKNKDGKIDINELTAYFDEQKVKKSTLDNEGSIFFKLTNSKINQKRIKFLAKSVE
jgi:Ca2+-binding EF-hand superfamily protein